VRQESAVEVQHPQKPLKLADCLGRRASLEIGYPVRQRLQALARDSLPKECNLCSSEDTLAGVEQDPVDL
jgi:hypothetical protein